MSAEARAARRWTLWRRAGCKCLLCDQPIPSDHVLDASVTNIDHIRPRSHRGSNAMDNLQLVHIPCNLAKGNRCPGCEDCFGIEIQEAAKQSKGDIERARLSVRHRYWREQGFKCPVDGVVILPSELATDAVGLFWSRGAGNGRLGRALPVSGYALAHVTCVAPSG